MASDYSYYDEITETIRQTLQNGDAAAAEALLRQELSMPYIPSDYEKTFRSLYKEVQRMKAEEKPASQRTLDDLLDHLHQSAQAQLQAAAELRGHNLRSCIEPLQDYLRDDPLPEAAALVIEALAEQKITEPFTLNKDGMTYEFYPDEVILPNEAEGFKEAMHLLEQIYGSNRPDVLHLCRTLLVHDVYLYLPLSYEKEEAAWLVHNTAQQISEMMGDESILQEALEVLKED